MQPNPETWQTPLDQVGARLQQGPDRDSTQLLTAIALGVITLLGAFLRFYELGAASTGNVYYAATVQSMLDSWHNFFFAAFEPGGSVSVDKQPLGFWIQALSASALGVNGFALALPQAIAGVLSLPLCTTCSSASSIPAPGPGGIGAPPPGTQPPPGGASSPR